MSTSFAANGLRRYFQDSMSHMHINQLSYYHVSAINAVLRKNDLFRGSTLVHMLYEVIRNKKAYDVTDNQYRVLEESYRLLNLNVIRRRNFGLPRDATKLENIPWDIEEGNEFARRFPPPSRR
jgi:hypothetical protein